ncbi:MAG: hypothetical protein ACE5DP_00215 [Fidelibacterota bacterium]
MVVITTALPSEARPIIRSLSLEQDHKGSLPKLYGNDEYTLLITGVGGVSVEKALGRFFKHLSERKRLFFVNVGIAGGEQKRANIGEMYVINKIVEAATGKTYLPDILLRHSLQEAALLTVEKAVTHPSNKDFHLVDMEAASVWKVASQFLPPHRMLFLKIVSDYCDGTPISAKQIQELVQENIIALLTLLRSCHQECFYDREILAPEDRDILTECRRVLRLTDTQYLRLTNLAEGYKVIRNKDIVSILKPYCTRTVTHKRERNRFFQTLCEQLTT